MHKNSYHNMSKFVDKYLNEKKSEKIKILDLGSQDVNGSFKMLFENPNWDYIGVDMEAGKNVDVVIKDVYNWKEFDSNTIDVLVTGSTLEHVELFWKTFEEINRVLKPGGICCVIVPSSGPEHKYPLDCWRFFPDGLKAVARSVGLEIIEAYNCWNDLPVEGEENTWKDSILIAKKTKVQ